ncbi:PHA/PHB synthase family protein [Massilia sp. GCM10020059]|uniref:Alpha/beta fold hydrolase n=1 Tax=Massilia agrisoli TaxID=2892444 RepID=A0ABS8IR71_9BURK|nr:alpha/beta fold hydrolase [Massilia agrisoli]MCC6070890.1 alpha/beta fold hydrolase [Massilia agrisoli]
MQLTKPAHEHTSLTLEVANPPAARTDMGGVRPTDVEPPSHVDRMLHALMGHYTQGISPNSLALAWTDWMLHLAQSPGKWQRLAQKAWDKDLRWFDYALRSAADPNAEPCIDPLPQDRRFRSEAWQRWPYNLIQQAFLLNQQWWHNATTGIDGVTKHHEQVVSFVARQLLDLVSPVNFVATNPEVSAAIVREHGANLVRGACNLMEDLSLRARGLPPEGAEAYRPGIEVAVTPGEVVYRNDLIELIQYAPATPSVHAEPVLIVPAWIMKYYIMDLSPHNSLVRYLVSHGHTVFMISWHNPTAGDRDLGLDDYLHEGVMRAFDTLRERMPGKKVNAVGYCLGGTLLSIAAAAYEHDQRAYLNSITLLAAQTDFSEAGELMLFIDESQVAWLEDLMWQQGYLDNRQMAGAFRLLRSNDLVWSVAVSHYLLGEPAPMSDLMAWNADTTRMPYRMHSDYLRKLFLNNDLFSGRYRVNGRPIALSDVHVPVFAVSTMTDHVAPWRSVYKVHLMSHCDVNFVLASGGHNAGIISEPGRAGRRYYTALHKRGDRYTDPDKWIERADEKAGSWWPEWLAWLDRVSPAGMVPAQPVTGSLGPAPGRYVLER